MTIFRALLLFFISVSLFSSCKKEEEAPATPFYKLLEGHWEIQKGYSINGQAFEFSDLELRSVLEFGAGTASCCHQNRGLMDSLGNNIPYDVWFERKDNGIRVEVPVFIKNDLGFIAGYGEDEATLVERYPLFKLLTTGFATNYIYESGDNYPFTQSRTWNNFEGKIYSGTITNLSSSDYEDPSDSFSGLKLTAYDEFSEFDHFSWDLGNFRVKNFNNSEMTLLLYVNYYNRILAGEVLLDVVELHLKKLNGSSIIDVPPFDIADYSKLFWEKMEDYPAAKLKGGAAIVFAGIDGNCLSFPTTNAYAFGERILSTNSTLSFWVNPASVNVAKQVLFSKYKNQYGPYIISLENDKLTIEINDGFGNLVKVQSGNALKHYTWTHVCLSINANNFGTLYINGAKDSAGTLPAVDYDADAQAMMGSTEQAVIAGQTNQNLKGYLDEIILFNEVLAPGEIYQLYNWHLTN